MNTTAQNAFEEIKRLLVAASTDATIPVSDYMELLNETMDFCEEAIDSIDEDDTDEEGEDLADEAANATITDESKTGGS
jgi:hypothetical protein